MHVAAGFWRDGQPVQAGEKRKHKGFTRGGGGGGEERKGSVRGSRNGTVFVVGSYALCLVAGNRVEGRRREDAP